MGSRIGEAWEFSCDPDFPSTLPGHNISLPELVQAMPEAVLSPGQAHTGVEILVKLLNAGDELSLQVHPADDDPNLSDVECGKPESWYILHAEEKAGIYLGFSKPVARDELRAMLLAGDDSARSVLQFVEVEPGDYFEIEPGVPHAIGGE